MLFFACINLFNFSLFLSNMTGVALENLCVMFIPLQDKLCVRQCYVTGCPWCYGKGWWLRSPRQGGGDNKLKRYSRMGGFGLKRRVCAVKAGCNDMENGGVKASGWVWVCVSERGLLV